MFVGSIASAASYFAAAWSMSFNANAARASFNSSRTCGELTISDGEAGAGFGVCFTSAGAGLGGCAGALIVATILPGAEAVPLGAFVADAGCGRRAPCNP